MNSIWFLADRENIVGIIQIYIKICFRVIDTVYKRLLCIQKWFERVEIREKYCENAHILFVILYLEVIAYYSEHHSYYEL